MEKNVSFESLVKKISPVLKRITYKLNGHFSFFNDEDLLQEALIHLWEDFKQGKLDDKTDSYILQGCYFHLKNYLRKTQDKARMVSINALSVEEGTTLEEVLTQDTPEPCFDRLDDKILSERIQGFNLTSREKEILSLCLDGLTVREIGGRLGISHVRVVKLRNKIRIKCQSLKGEIENSYQKS